LINDSLCIGIFDIDYLGMPGGTDNDCPGRSLCNGPQATIKLLNPRESPPFVASGKFTLLTVPDGTSVLVWSTENLPYPGEVLAGM
jgi:hypothetical protein